MDACTRPMWRVLLTLVLVHSAAYCMCPARCHCNDEVLRASCRDAGLEVVPIQLNPEVRFIYLSRNKISNVHYTLTFYPNLIGLDLSDNKIKSLGSSNFELQRNLEYLNLSNNEIQSLTKDSLRGLRNLTELNLDSNNLEELYAIVFKDLRYLQVLRLKNNQLMYIEEGLLAHCENLRELHLSGNQLLEIPAIRDALKLETLSLSSNLLASINEDDFATLSELKTLRLDNNVISDIDEGAMAGLKALQFLDLGNNNLTWVPTASLSKLFNLTSLHFGGNSIRSIPPVAFRGLFRLTYLRLDRLDLLTSIDARAFIDNIHLERILLDDNIALESLPTRLFYGNPRLTHISIRNNRLKTLQVSHFPLDHLKVLKLGNNPFECNCSLLWLWRLEQEQRALEEYTNETAPAGEGPLLIDVDNVRCDGPEELTDVLLIHVSESQMECSIGWVTVLFVVILTCVVVVTVSTLFCFIPARKHLNSGKLRTTRQDIKRANSTSLSITYEDPTVDKCMMGASLIREYQTVPLWNASANGTDAHVYKQFNKRYKPKSHIVYV